MNGSKRIQESLTICLYVCCFVVVVVVVAVVAVVLFFGGEGWSNTRWTVIPFSGGFNNRILMVASCFWYWD